MPFVAKADTFLDDAGGLSDHKRLPEMKETIRFMLKNAVGVDHAISTQKIVDHLQELKYPVISIPDWQMNVLGPLRKSGVFIASKRATGMFIIKDQNDAKVAISQIQSRIDEERARLNILKDMCRNVGFKID